MSNAPDITVLFQQKRTLVVNKPGGVLTQAPPGIDSMELRVKQKLKSTQDDPIGKTYVGVPHRLDRPVSGVMVFGQNKHVTKELSAQFRNRTTEKIYWAIVAGTVTPAKGVWTDWMRKLPDEAKSEITDSEHPDARQAELAYQVLGLANGFSWMQIELKTGRTHQIRLQTSSRGFPILGDAQYGSEEAFGPETLDFRARWIALHARRLAFDLPNSSDRVEITAGTPTHWEEILKHFSTEDFSASAIC